MHHWIDAKGDAVSSTPVEMPSLTWLRFPDPQMEKDFIRHYDEDLSPTVNRVAMGLALVIFAGFGIVDQWAIPKELTTATWLRYTIGTPALLIALILSFFSALRPWMQLINCTAAVLAGLTLDSLIGLASRDEHVYHYYFAGIISIQIFLYAFFRLRFWYALVTNSIILVGYEIAMIIFHQALTNPHDFYQLFTCNVFLLSTNVVGASACYSFEHYARKDFWQRRRIEVEKARNERLLLNILPKEIVPLLRENEARIVAEEFKSASVLFADIVNFTPLSARLSASELVRVLDDLFSRFDALAEKHKVEKIKTIGDCYMVAAGVPIPRQSHAQTLIEMGLDMREAILNFNENGHDLNVRIGISSGPLVAGVIGRSKFIYDLWGDTVNTASRMESHGKPGQIQISRATYDLILEHFECEARGVIMVKGKGEMEVWHVQGRRVVTGTENVVTQSESGT